MKVVRMLTENLMSLIQDKTTPVKKEEYMGIEVIETMHWFIQSFQSENTRQSYARHLEEFFLFSYKVLKVKITTIKIISERLVIIWKESLSQFSLASIARKLSTLSSFLNFAKKRGLIDYNVLELIKKPKIYYYN